MNYDTGESGEPPRFDGPFRWLKALVFYAYALIALPLVLSLIVLFIEWRVRR